MVLFIVVTSNMFF